MYTLLIGTVFVHFGPVKQAGVMLACYALGILAAVGTAYVFRRSLLKGGTTSFILELPSYKMPQMGEVARQVWKNSAQFVTKAGTTILFISILLWAVSYYPRMPETRANEVRNHVPYFDNTGWTRKKRRRHMMKQWQTPQQLPNRSTASPVALDMPCNR